MTKKYIIEIEEEPFIRKSVLHGEETLYRAKGFKSLVFDQVGLDKLTPIDENDEVKEDDFLIGDEVIIDEALTGDGIKAVIMDESDEPGVYMVFNENGCIQAIYERFLKKTGVHYDTIDTLLERMRV